MTVVGFGGGYPVRAGEPLDYFLPAGTNYDPKVPTPEQFFGFQVGDWHLHSELINAYLRRVASAVPTRVRSETIGRTHEGKPLLVLTITSPENHERIEEIRRELRDWLPLVHPEARARVELFHRWWPNLLTDHHEMGTNNTLFFQPGVRTRNNPGIPNQVVELTGKIAAFHQRALDGKGMLYSGEILAAAPPFPVGKLIGGHSHYAYLFHWNGYFASRALLRLQQAGVLVKGLTGASLEAIAADGTRATFAPGAVLVPVGLQPDKAALIRTTIDTIVKEDATTVYGCATGLTPHGVDFGSASFVSLALPKAIRPIRTDGDGADAHEHTH